MGVGAGQGEAQGIIPVQIGMGPRMMRKWCYMKSSNAALTLYSPHCRHRVLPEQDRQVPCASIIPGNLQREDFRSDGKFYAKQWFREAAQWLSSMHRRIPRFHAQENNSVPCTGE